MTKQSTYKNSKSLNAWKKVAHVMYKICKFNKSNLRCKQLLILAEDSRAKRLRQALNKSGSV